MADKRYIFTPNQDLQVDTGKGHLAGAIVSSTSAVSGACTVYDYAGMGPPLITQKIFEIMVNANNPVIILYNDRFAPRFYSGVWLHSSADVYVTLFVHIPTP
jgi:hypothetical protein